MSSHLVVGMTVAVLASATQAITIYVDDDNCPGPGSGTEFDPFCSIQTAIDNAADTDEILVAPGTYFEAIDLIGKAVTLRSSDGPEVTVIDGTGYYHVVQCVSGEESDTVLDGFTITGGYANGSYPDSTGGGMCNLFSSPTVTNCTFSGNNASSGGGMYSEGGSPTVTNCTFSGNNGGGMHAGNATVIGCTFSGNHVGGYGGGMAAENATVIGCTFSENSSGLWSGGMGAGNSTVIGCTFSGNSSGINGGGMGADNATVIGCTFSGNSSGWGGGISTDWGPDPTVTNCTFIGNQAGMHGGGMHIRGTDPTLINCTFVGNVAAETGGGMHSDFDSRPVAVNCIFWGNVGGQIVDDSGATAIVYYSNVQGGYPGTGNINTDPACVDPASGDVRLSTDSPCIDAGLNAAVPVGVATDLDGNPRFVDDPSSPDCWQDPGTCGDPPVVDMGAYEFWLPCPWDLDGDGTVGITDFLDLLAAWDTDPGGPPDFDGDGVVEITDCLELLANWGPCSLFVDCNGNDVWDVIDLQNGTSPDCNSNGVPDECDVDNGASPDCNANGTPDECDIADGTSEDCNGNGVPDECDIDDGASPDCNANETPDECDIADGTSLDCMGNGIPDECECPGDLNGDGEVEISDFLQMLADWGACPGCSADIDCDGMVDVQDFLDLLAYWGPCP